ncbi:hypothetical protein PAMP_018380 [Pampus punctatissimus]
MEKRERGVVSCQLNRALRQSFGGSCEDGRISLVPGVKIRAVGRASSENVSEWTADGSGSYTGCLGCAEHGWALAPILPSPSTASRLLQSSLLPLKPQGQQPPTPDHHSDSELTTTASSGSRLSAEL